MPIVPEFILIYCFRFRLMISDFYYSQGFPFVFPLLSGKAVYIIFSKFKKKKIFWKFLASFIYFLWFPSTLGTLAGLGTPSSQHPPPYNLSTVSNDLYSVGDKSQVFKVFLTDFPLFELRLAFFQILCLNAIQPGTATVRIKSEKMHN